MTLIVTQISQFGIVQAADSNLTAANGSPAGTARKIFPIPHLSAAASVAGSFSVGGTTFDAWLGQFVQDESAAGNNSLQSFATGLKDKLEAEMTATEAQSGSIVHLAGYAPSSGDSQPARAEFYHIRNSHGIDSVTGNYSPSQKFLVDEDFATTYMARPGFSGRLNAGYPMVYANGFPSGRINFFSLYQALHQFFLGVWANPSWQFHPPASLQESARFVRVYIEVVGALFMASNYSAPFIGGPVAVYAIPPPPATASWE